MNKCYPKIISNRGNSLVFKYVYPEKNNPKIMAQLVMVQKSFGLISEKEAIFCVGTWARIHEIETEVHNKIGALISSSEVL